MRAVSGSSRSTLDAQGELARQLALAHTQLAERDDEIRRLVQGDEEIARLRAEVERLDAEVRYATMALDAMTHTRAWRAIELYWRVRGRVLGG